MFATISSFAILKRRISSAILLQHHGGILAHKLNEAAIEAALKAGDGSPTAILNSQNESIIEDSKRIEGISKLIVRDDKQSDENFEHLIAESSVPWLQSLQKKYAFTHWWAGHSTQSKEILPRLAGSLMRAGDDEKQIVCVLSDVFSVKNENLFERSIYAGNAQTEVKTLDNSLKLITVRPSAFVQTGGRDRKEPETVKEPATCTMLAQRDWIKDIVGESERPDLGAAEIIVSGGRALKGEEGFKLVYSLADTLGAAVGASRAAVDASFCPPELQVGQTGRIVAPKLYIAIGISGAIQHVAGMKDSKLIVAINKDAECSMVKMADFALVGDVFKILPEMTQKLQKETFSANKS